MKRAQSTPAFRLSLLAVLALCACAGLSAGKADTPIPLSASPGGADVAARFGKYYQPVAAAVTPQVPPYVLPLKPADIQNGGEVPGKLGLPGGLPPKLLENGFATVPCGAQDDIVKAYEDLKEKGVPVFVTSDSVLHLYHIQFDETLREIEEKEFYPDLVALNGVLQGEMQKRYEGSGGELKTAYRKGLAYFSVAGKLLQPDAKIPPAVKSQTEWELARIEKHEGFPSEKEARENSIFTYPEDYSQYVPRGHYTRSEELKRYFKAMMWYGRMTMLNKGSEASGPWANLDALVSLEEAKAQTTLGCVISALLPQLKVGERTAEEVWTRIYAVTAYYVGLADDLTPVEYRTALAKVFGGRFAPGALSGSEQFLKLQTELARLRKPAIYSGTGASGVNLDAEPGGVMTPKQLDAILAKTQGFRMMGQRFVPDSYMMGQLVAPVTQLGKNPKAFTAVVVPDLGIIRGFPRGLDVMAVLGSERALAVLRSLGDADYGNYEARLSQMRAEYGKLSPADWNRNLYWSWLYALGGLTRPAEGKGWPTFMTSASWQDKELNAALGSWSSLRHDTILYAKQSYTPRMTTEAAPFPRTQPLPVVGYVEPVPEFYARLVALTRMTSRGLQDLKAPSPGADARLKSLDGLLSRLLALSEKELQNQVLTEEDYAFIRTFGESLNSVVAGASESGQKTTLVADVHTDQNTESVLEEGTGYLRLLLVAYKLPQGHVLVGAGPAFSYYEFKHPMKDRLTDEKWREMLGGGKAPPLPEWTSSFAQ